MTIRPFLLIVAACAVVSAADPFEVRLGVLWATKSSMADRIYAGMAQVIQAKAPAIRIEVRPAMKDDAAASALYEQWQSTKQGIVFLRSAGAVAMVEHPPRIPCFIGAANNPVELGVMKDMARPDGLVTGVTYFLPYGEHLKAFRLLWPGLSRVGVLLAAGHPSTPVEERGLAAAASALGITLDVRHCAAKADVSAMTAALVSAGNELVVIGNQALIFDNAAAVTGAAGRVPVMSLADKPIAAKQVVGGLGVDDFFLGQRLGEAVVAVLVDHRPVAEIPVATDPAPKLRLVMDRIRALALVLPPSALEQAVKVE